MSQPLIVFVHGGQHTKDCWQPTIDAIYALNPEAQMLPVNLPGHGDEPGDLATLTILQCVESVTEKIQALEPEQVILVGHSMAGITIPGVAAKLGKDRIRRMIYLACCIPPQGKRVLDTLHAPMSFIASFAAKTTAVSKPLPKWFASWVFTNGASKSQKELMHRCLCDESTRVSVEAIDRSNYPDVPNTWILPLQDRAVNPALQRTFIENLGNVQEVIELDTCHNAMITRPNELAELILKYY